MNTIQNPTAEDIIEKSNSEVDIDFFALNSFSKEKAIIIKEKTTMLKRRKKTIIILQNNISKPITIDTQRKITTKLLIRMNPNTFTSLEMKIMLNLN